MNIIKNNKSRLLKLITIIINIKNKINIKSNTIRFINFYPIFFLVFFFIRREDNGSL